MSKENFFDARALKRATSNLSQAAVEASKEAAAAVGAYRLTFDDVSGIAAANVVQLTISTTAEQQLLEARMHALARDSLDTAQRVVEYHLKEVLGNARYTD